MYIFLSYTYKMGSDAFDNALSICVFFPSLHIFLFHKIRLCNLYFILFHFFLIPLICLFSSFDFLSFFYFLHLLPKKYFSSVNNIHNCLQIEIHGARAILFKKKSRSYKFIVKIC